MSRLSNPKQRLNLNLFFAELPLMAVNFRSSTCVVAGAA
jgi:hypothetical protein